MEPRRQERPPDPKPDPGLIADLIELFVAPPPPGLLAELPYLYPEMPDDDTHE